MAPGNDPREPIGPPTSRPAARRGRRAGTVLAGVVAAAGLVAAACSGSIEARVSDANGPTPTTAPAKAPEWPLTGEPAPDIRATETSAVVAKIDNDPQAWPHTAVNTADVVYEVWVEGITRLAAVFHSDIPEEVGPVRSGRSTDIDLVSNLGRPVLVFSGGNARVLGQINEAANFGILVNASQDVAPNDYRRDNNRFAPYNLYANAIALQNQFGTVGEEHPTPLWDFRDGDAEPAGDPAAGVSVNFGPGATVVYVWDPEEGCARRFERNEQATDATDDSPVCATNVVVLNTPYGQSVADARSPQAYTIGAGDGVVLSGGRTYGIVWNRPDGNAGWNLATGFGVPVELGVGNTWVAMPPVGQGSVELLDPLAAAALLGAPPAP